MARAHQPGGTGSPAQVVVGAQGGPWGGSRSQRPGHTEPGGTWSTAQVVVGAQGGPAWCSSFQKAWAHLPGGTGSPIQTVVGAEGRPARGMSSQWPGHTNPGRRGVLPRWWSVLKEGLWGVAVPNGPVTPSRGDGESCRGGGPCSGRACAGLQLPTARAHLRGGTGGPVQAMVGAQGGSAGAAAPNGPGTPAWGTEVPAQAAAGFRGVPSGGSSLQQRVPAGRGGCEAVPGRWPLLRHALTGPVHPLRRRASPCVELWARSSGPKTLLTPRPRELEDGDTLRPYLAMLSSKQAR